MIVETSSPVAVSATKLLNTALGLALTFTETVAEPVIEPETLMIPVYLPVAEGVILIQLLSLLS